MDSGDADEDSDGDKMTNREEYLAGTDPQDPHSFLKLDSTSAIGQVILHFGAVSNRTYTLEYSETASGGLWQPLTDFVAAPTNRIETAVDPTLSKHRFYRIVTPRILR